jgi:hypothetical protein
MSDKNQLPDGVTFNQDREYDVDVTNEPELINESTCNLCGTLFQALLYTFGTSRHVGSIKRLPGNKELWNNPLPKDIVRCKKILNEKLVERIEKHKEIEHHD